MSNQQVIQVPCLGCGCQSGGLPNPGCCDPLSQNIDDTVDVIPSGFADCPYCFSVHGGTTAVYDFYDHKFDLSAINGNWPVPNFPGSCSYQVVIPNVVPVHFKRRFVADKAPCNNSALNQTLMQSLRIRYDMISGAPTRRFVTISVGGQFGDPEPRDRLNLNVFCGVIFGPTTCIGVDHFSMGNGCVNPADPVLGYFPQSTNVCPLPPGNPPGPWYGGGEVEVVRGYGIGEEDI